jgi:hypothetical protein
MTLFARGRNIMNTVRVKPGQGDELRLVTVSFVDVRIKGFIRLPDLAYADRFGIHRGGCLWILAFGHWSLEFLSSSHLTVKSFFGASLDTVLFRSGYPKSRRKRRQRVSLIQN